MGRRYKRREFLTDAAVAAAGSILLKVCAPSSSTTVSHPVERLQAKSDRGKGLSDSQANHL